MAILFVVAVLIQTVVAASTIWLSSSTGKTWIHEKIGGALQGTGYTVAYQDLLYSDIRSLSINNLVVSDAAGVLLKADHAELKIALLPLLERKLSLSLQAGTIDLDHLPTKEKDDTATTNIEQINSPDIYFHSVTLNDLHINRLNLSEKILGQRMTLAPHVMAEIALAGKIAANLSMALDQIDGTDIAWLPRSLDFNGTLDPATTQISITSLNIAAPAYKIEGKGSYAIASAQPVSLQISAAITQLDKLVRNMQGTMFLNAGVTGTASAPAITADGRADIDLLKQRGLDTVTFHAEIPGPMDNIQGSLALNTTYKKLPVTLGADLHYAGSKIRIENLKGSAPDLTLSGEGIVNTVTMFIDGKINANIDNLATYSDLTSIKLEGKGSVTATFEHPDTQQAVNLSAILDNIRYDTMTLTHAEATAALSDITNPWPHDMDLKMRGFRAGDATIKNLTAALKQKTDKVYHLALDATGNFNQAFQISGGADVSDIAEAHPNLSNIDLKLKSLGNVLNLKGDLNRDTINITASTTRFSMRGLPVTLPEVAQNFTLSGKTLLTGPLSAPLMTSDMHLNTGGAGTKSVPPVNLAILADYKDGLGEMNVIGKGKGIKALTAALKLPLTLSLQPFRFSLPDTTALNGNIALSGEAAGLLQPFLPGDTALNGHIDASAKISGTLGTPTVDGSLVFSNGVIRDEGSGLHLKNINLNTVFNQTSVTLKNMTAQDADQGKITGSGKIGFGKTASGQLDFIFSQFHTMRTDMVDAVVTGTLAVQGQSNGYKISGVIDPQQTSITIPERLQNAIPQLNIIKPGQKKSTSLAQSVSLDITVKANNRVFVRGWGLDAEFGGDIAVGGTLGQPLMNGNLTSIRGRYDEFGRHFTLDHATLRFQGAVPPSPYLDIKANLSASDVVASVLISGPVRVPVLSFVSTPSLPQDEVFSRILFGKNMSKISPFQAIQLEQSLRRFSGKGSSGFDPLGKLRSATGLDDISVDSDASGATTVGAGKYISDKVYIGVQRGQSETSGAANIRVDVTPNIAVDSRVGQDAQGGAGVSWHWDY